jgi:hypothetical protein
LRLSCRRPRGRVARRAAPRTLPCQCRATTAYARGLLAPISIADALSLAKTGVARFSLTIANTSRQEARHHRNVLCGCRDEHVRLQARQALTDGRSAQTETSAPAVATRYARRSRFPACGVRRECEEPPHNGLADAISAISVRTSGLSARRPARLRPARRAQRRRSQSRCQRKTVSG